MGVDQEVQNVFYTISDINSTFVKLDYQMVNASTLLAQTLDEFDAQVNNIVEEVNSYKNMINGHVEPFPSQWIYLAILLFLIAILLSATIWMMIRVHHHVTHFQQRVGEHRRALILMGHGNRQSDLPTPPPTYGEYVATADIYRKYHEELDTAHRAGYRGTPEELSKLI